VINLIYTRCTASCPLETAKLAQVQRLLAIGSGRTSSSTRSASIRRMTRRRRSRRTRSAFTSGRAGLFLTGKDEDVRLVSKKLGLSSAHRRGGLATGTSRP